MLIKQSNLQSALTHIREALSTLATLNSDEQGYFHNHIVEQLTEAETVLMDGAFEGLPEMETNEPNSQTPTEQLDEIKADIFTLIEVERPKIYSLLTRLDYHDSSRVSYLIDSLEVLGTKTYEMHIKGE